MQVKGAGYHIRAGRHCDAGLKVRAKVRANLVARLCLSGVVSMYLCAASAVFL